MEKVKKVNYRDAVFYLKRTVKQPEIMSIAHTAEPRKMMVTGESTPQQRYFMEVRVFFRSSVCESKKLIYEHVFELDDTPAEDKHNVMWKRVFEDLLLLYPYIDDEVILAAISQQ